MGQGMEQGAGRRHDIDSLRVIAFGLLILFHLGMFYVEGWSWHLKSEHTAGWLWVPMGILSQFRIPLLFLISGLVLSIVWGRQAPGAFARRRLLRLGLPLLVGMLVIVPPQAYYEALAGGVIERGYLAFLVRYLSFGGWPEGAFLGSHYGITWNHLWYLAYLLSYTLLLIPLTAIAGPQLAAIRRVLQGLRGPVLVLLPVLPMLLYDLLIQPHFPHIRFDLFTDAYGHALFLTYFLLGFLMGTDQGLWDELERLRGWTLLAALLCGALLIGQQIAGVEATGGLAQQAESLLIHGHRWLWLLTLLGWGRRLLWRPQPWLPYANEAVYPWYLLHQTLIVVAGYELSQLALGPVLEPMLLFVITIGGCALLHELVIRRSAWLRPLFGLGPRR